MEVEESAAGKAVRGANDSYKESAGLMRRLTLMIAKQTVKGDKREDVVTLKVSHPDLVKNVREGMEVRVELAGDIKQRLELQKKLKEQALKEVTDKLDIGPVKFNPAGLAQS